MSSVKKSYWTETLPDPLPANPLVLASKWLAEAIASPAQPNPNAMVLATVDGHGQPSARVVLCKRMVADPGFIVFYTNYRSRKGTELTGNPRAAAVFHWDHVHRQIRIEGRVETMSEADNDAYFETRAWQSRLGAWASQQSQPVASRKALAEAVAREALRFGIDYRGPGTEEPGNVTAWVPRPPNWGGFRLQALAVELWVEGEFRIHDRVRWTRAAVGEDWHAVRLQP
jgi:pyridoxamine 5'-phosphate oxidase